MTYRFIGSCLAVFAMVELIGCGSDVADLEVEVGPATCSDGQKNGTESDVDCGGTTCARCATDRACETSADCASSVCIDGTCVSPDAPVIESFTAAATRVTAGKSTTLTAVFSGGTATIDHGVGDVSSGTPVTTGVAGDTTYTLTVTNVAGEQVSRTVDIATVAAPVITSFAAASAKISKYTETTISGTFSGGTGIVDQDIGAVTSGFEAPTGTLTAPASYTLTVTNELGDSATATADVYVKKELFVASSGYGGVLVFDEDAAGDVAPKRRIDGNQTGLGQVGGIFIVGDELVTTVLNRAIYTFNVTDEGNVAPRRAIYGDSTTLEFALGIHISGGEMFIGDQSSTMKVWNLTDAGDVAPKRVVRNARTEDDVTHTWVDDGELYVGNYGSGTVTVYPVGASGDTVPTRTLTVPGGTPLGLRVVGDNLVVAQAIGAIRTLDKRTGTLVRTVSGDATKLGSLATCAVNDAELYCTVAHPARVVVFPLDANGNVAPIRTLEGWKTGLNYPQGVLLH